MICYLHIEQLAQAVKTGNNRCGVMPNKHMSKTDPNEAMVYQIRLEGHLGCEWTDWFEGMTITLGDMGDTLLTGPVADQAALYGLLRKMRDLGMPLVSINRVESEKLC